LKQSQQFSVRKKKHQVCQGPRTEVLRNSKQFAGLLLFSLKYEDFHLLALLLLRVSFKDVKQQHK
jgi:hypothetical protein